MVKKCNQTKYPTEVDQNKHLSLVIKFGRHLQQNKIPLNKKVNGIVLMFILI